MTSIADPFYLHAAKARRNIFHALRDGKGIPDQRNQRLARLLVHDLVRGVLEPDQRFRRRVQTLEPDFGSRIEGFLKVVRGWMFAIRYFAPFGLVTPMTTLVRGR